MSLVPSPTVRLAGTPDVGDLIRLAAKDNPLLREGPILGREIVTDRLGLIMAGGASGATLLYLWTQPIEDVSPWMAHAAQWLDRYPIWRKAHGLVPSAEPVRMVLAAPDVGDRARSALRLLLCPVTLTRYASVELGGQVVLAWEPAFEGVGRGPDQSGVGSQPGGEGEQTSSIENLTMEELAFFRTV